MRTHNLLNQVKTGLMRNSDIILHASNSIICYTVALIIFRQILPKYELLRLFEMQVYFVIVSSLLLSVLWYFLRFWKAVALLFFIKFIFLLVIGYPFGEHLYFELLLAIPLIFDCLIFLRKPYGALASVSVVIILVLMQKEFLVWNRTVPAPPLLDHFFFAVVLLFVTVIGGKESIRDEILRRTQIFGHGGGYMISCSNHLQRDISPSQIVEMFRVLDTLV